MVHVSRRRSGPTYRAKRVARVEREREMKRVSMRTRVTVLAVTVLVAVLALSGVAWAADPLVVTKTAPNGRATGVAPTANIEAYFNRDVAVSTVTSRKFKIRKKGTTTWLGATRSVDNTISPTSTNGGSESVVTLNPDADLAPNTIYQVVIVGGTTGVKGVNGEILSTTKRWTFTTANDTPPDTTPPDTFIDSGPTGTVTSDSASFSFSSSKSGSTFQCSLDGIPFSGCTSPKNYTGLINGSHTFQVRAIDATTGTDPTPASRTWTVNKATTGVTVTPTTLDLSPTDVLGCARTEDVTVTNNGPGNVTFANVSITGTGAKYFSDGATRFILNNGPFTVLAGNYFFDEVTFTAGPTAGERNSATVYNATLTYKDSTGATIGDPVTLTATARCLNFG